MSKIYLIGDSHIGLGYPNKTDKWFKTHQEYFSKFLIPLLKSKVKKGDIIVHLGDLFDNRNIIPINLMNYAMDVVEEISKIAPLHIIVGNHDLWSKSASEINSIRPFKYIPNVHIYDSVSKIEFNGCNILMMPYFDSKIDQVNAIKSNRDCEYLFCHSDLNGAKMHLTSVAHRNLDKIDIDDFSSFRKVYSGHIHLTQVSKNFTFVGSIFQMDRNDYGDQKGIFVIDTIDGSESFIKNEISPVFVKYRVLCEDDIDGLESLIGSNDYIDVYISNNLLINSRKLRRKIEVILENGGFASIEYIDDMVQTNEVGDKIIESLEMDNEIDISLQLDYGEYIREYIQKQKYDNDKFKQGVISEYDDIVNIYNDNYLNSKKK